MAAIRFRLEGTDPAGGARAGVIETARGEVPTPAFMPVGTRGAVRALDPREIEEAGGRILLANTYHLYLRPGHDLVRERGGLHRFMGWNRPILTDSGGFQVYSLASLGKIGEEGVEFRSHLDGSAHLFTPEKVMEIQAALGVDVAMSFDHCPPLPSDRKTLEDSVRRTTAWAARGRRAMDALPEERTPEGRKPALFGIVQGGLDPALRRRSAEEIAAIGFDGHALGGLSVGETKEEMHGALAFSVPLLPAEKPRYLMGVGFPEDILEAIGRGIDLFDCVLPTRMARNGTLLTSRGRLVVKNGAYARDDRPPDPDCDCPACRLFTRAYLRHLFAAGEILALRSASIHNLTFYFRIVRGAREAILRGRFSAWRDSFLERWFSGEGI